MFAVVEVHIIPFLNHIRLAVADGPLRHWCGGFESAAGDGWVSADGIGGHGSFRVGSRRLGAGGEEG